MNLNPATYNWTLLELRAFCLVCDQKNLSSTAQRLGITQQTLSMMVRRWREALRDPIYTRSRYGVLPTEFSIALRSQLERPLQEVQQALNEPRQFDPSTTRRKPPYGPLKPGLPRPSAAVPRLVETWRLVRWQLTATWPRWSALTR